MMVAYVILCCIHCFCYFMLSYVGLCDAMSCQTIFIVLYSILIEHIFTASYAARRSSRFESPKP